MFLCVLMEKFICVGNILLKRVAGRSAATPGYLMSTSRQLSSVYAITHGLVCRLYSHISSTVDIRNLTCFKSSLRPVCYTSVKFT